MREYTELNFIKEFFLVPYAMMKAMLFLIAQRWLPSALTIFWDMTPCNPLKVIES
jgi:hypothetical protein